MSNCDSTSHLMNDWVPLVRLCCDDNWWTFDPVPHSEQFIFVHGTVKLCSKTTNFQVRCVGMKWRGRRKKSGQSTKDYGIPKLKHNFLFIGVLWVSSRFLLRIKNLIELNVVQNVEINALGDTLGFFLDNSWSVHNQKYHFFLILLHTECVHDSHHLISKRTPVFYSSYSLLCDFRLLVSGVGYALRSLV